MSACAAASLCACYNGVSDLRRMERELNERKRMQQEQQLEEQQPVEQTDELDPDFLLDPEEDDKDAELPENSKSPDDAPPQYGKRPPRRRGHGPKPAPFPQPPDDSDGQTVNDSSF